MTNPFDPVEQQLSEWQRRGGPGRLDRAAARRPRWYAAVYAMAFTIAIGAGMTFSAIRVGAPWVWALAAAVLIPAAVGLFLAHHKSATRTSEAMRQWNARTRETTGDPDVAGPHEDRPS